MIGRGDGKVPKRGRGEQAQKSPRSRDKDGSCSAENSRGTQRSSEGCRRDAPEAPARQRFPQCERYEEDRDPLGRKQEIRGHRKARNLRLKHSTERSRLRRPRRVQVHVHGGRGVDCDGCDECEIHVRAETELSESHRCEVAPIQKMARKSRRGTEICRVEKQGADRQEIASAATTHKQQEVQQTVQQFQPGEEARTIAVKDAVESKKQRSRS